MVQFAIGDFVLYADVCASTRTKLSVRWCGPARVVGTVSNWIFTIEHLVTGEHREAHGSRLKFYADASLAVSEDLLQHVAHNSEGDNLREVRYDLKSNQFQFLVHWRGLHELEDSWEPAHTLLEDVPALVKVFARDHLDDPTVKRLAKVLRIPA